MNQQSADAVIIGGGVIGAAIAYYLAKRGVKPIILERKDICSGSSGACDKAVSMQSKNPGIALELAVESRAMYKTLAEELECETEYQECGGMIAIQSEPQLGIMQQFVARQRQNGLEVELLDSQEARRRQPALAPEIIAATFSPMDARVNPLKTTFGFARAARRMGAKIHTGAEVQGILVRHGRVTGVATGSGTVNTPIVINAAGAWAPFIARMAGIEVPIIPRRGQLAVTEAVPGFINGEMWSARYIAAKHSPDLIRREDPAAADLGVGLSVSQTGEGNLLIGGTREFAGYNTGTTPEALAAILRHAAGILPALKKVHVIRTFAGLRPYTPDGKPILGPVDGLEGFIMAAGHEGDGIALAPVTGRMIADYVSTGMITDKMRQLSLRRFKAGSALE